MFKIGFKDWFAVLFFNFVAGALGNFEFIILGGQNKTQGIAGVRSEREFHRADGYSGSLDFRLKFRRKFMSAGLIDD